MKITVQENYTETAVPYIYYTNLSAENSAVHSFSSSSAPPSPYITNLTANATSTWFANVTAAYRGFGQYHNVQGRGTLRA